MISNKTILSLGTLIFLEILILQGGSEAKENSNVPDNFSSFKDQNITESKREGKVFSLFNVVKFKNSGCLAKAILNGGEGANSFRHGTCYTSDECSKKGGSVGGSCAAGFGVCCVFTLTESGSKVTQNCSYLQNPNFPKPYDENGPVSYKIEKCAKNICSLRLDFETFTIQGTGNTFEVDTNVDPPIVGGVCKDTFTLSVNTGSRIPTICGQNTGQHVYLDIGNLDSDTADVKFQFDGSASLRQWEIKVTQIHCNSEGHPRGSGCLQYHTTLTGRLTTFNFLPTNDNHLANQDYSICIRQEIGFCCVEYSVCPDLSSFSIDIGESDSQIDDDCAEDDYIGIETAEGSCSKTTNPRSVAGKFCGAVLNIRNDETNSAPVCDCTAPFQVDIFTNSLSDTDEEDPNTVHSRGVCLEYRQIPC